MIVKFLTDYESVTKDAVLTVEFETGIYLSSRKIVSILDITDSEGNAQGQYGDYPVQGIVKVTAPAGYYFASASVFGDTTMTALEVSGVANVADSYFNKVMPSGMWHPFTAKITAITLSGGELQTFLKPLV